VPHVRIEPLGDDQVEEFLSVHDPQQGPALWRQLRGTPQLDLFRSPFYLRLLLAQAGAGGPALQGRAALFTAFVRQALQREIEAGNPLFRPGALLEKRDHERLVQRAWRNASDLPERGRLLPALCQLAYGLQARRAPGEASRVRVAYDDARTLLGAQQGDEPLLHAGVALQVLEVQWDDVFFVHQLLQEYFAGRAVAGKAQPELVAGAWRPTRWSPSLPDVLAGLADSDPLPAAPTTGWEETFVLAAAMAPAAEAFVTALDGGEPAARRPLRRAARRRRFGCAAPAPAASAGRAQPRSGRRPARAHRRRPRARRTRRPALRKPRAGTATTCCHRCSRSPPAATRSAATKACTPTRRRPIEVEVAASPSAQFPVTNAEWRCSSTRGYRRRALVARCEDAQRWQRGEGTDGRTEAAVARTPQGLRDNPERIGELLGQGPNHLEAGRGLGGDTADVRRRVRRTA
jgi:hypothetical protein